MDKDAIPNIYESDKNKLLIWILIHKLQFGYV